MTIQKRTRHGVVHGDNADHERAFVARKRLRWADDWLEPGDEIPSDRAGRNMASLVREGAITEVRRRRGRSDDCDCGTVG